MEKFRRFYDWKGYTVNLNIILDAGNLLTVEGEGVPESVVTEELGFEDPDFVDVAFSGLTGSQ